MTTTNSEEVPIECGTCAYQGRSTVCSSCEDNFSYWKKGGLTGRNADLLLRDEVGTSPNQPAAIPENPKAIYGRAKPSLGLVPSGAMIEMAGVYALGADKYGPFNWRKSPVEAMTYVHALLRHLQAWVDGEDTDPESGCSHMAHAACCATIIIDAMHSGTLIDNRPHKGPAARLIRERTKKVA